MEECFRLKATKVTPKMVGIEIRVDCTGEELTQILADAMIQISDAQQHHFKVKNGFWLLLNDCINTRLKERTLK